MAHTEFHAPLRICRISSSGCIFPYCKNASIFVCPSDQQAATTAFKASYSMNAYLDWGYPIEAPGDTYGINEALIHRPSKVGPLIDEGGGSVVLRGRGGSNVRW